MYIQIYNVLKRCLECKCRKICVKTVELLHIMFLLRRVFVDSGTFMGGGETSISYCQSTGVTGQE